MSSLTSGALISSDKTLFHPFSAATLHSSSSSSPSSPSPIPSFRSPYHLTSKSSSRARVSSSFNPNCRNTPIIEKFKRTTSALILTTAAALLVGKVSTLPARAEPPAPATEEKLEREEDGVSDSSDSPLSQFLESHSEAVDALKSLLQRKLEDGEDSEALKILRRLVSAQPAETQWKFLMARLLNEMGELEESRKVFEEILQDNPLSFEALFENALLMDKCGDGEAVIERLEEALEVAKQEGKEKEARDVRFIMAQIQFLQKNVEEALRSYEELSKEDPNDFRPYFCQGVIYSLLDKNQEARVQFKKYHELSPKKFDVEGFLQTPLSRMKLFGTESEN